MAPKFLPDRVLVSWILPGGGVLGGAPLLPLDPDSKMEILSISLDLFGEAIFVSKLFSIIVFQHFSFFETHNFTLNESSYY